MHELCSEDEYCNAIRTIIEARRLVVYCGAGVTLSRTRLGWKSLVQKLADSLLKTSQFKVEELNRPDFQEALKERVGLDEVPVIQNATLVAELLAAESSYEGGSNFYPQAKMRRHIATHLYRHSGSPDDANRIAASEPTELLKYTSALIVSFIASGKEVAVVTTNYDTFLEMQLRFHISAYVSERPDVDPISLKILGSQKVPKTDQVWSKGSLSLVYLHGRIPRDSDPKSYAGKAINNGQVVFSEAEYAESESRVSAWLDTSALDSDCLLILGASMEDRPLLRFLQKNRAQKMKSHRRHCDSIILVKSSDPGDPGGARVSVEKQRRRTHIERLRYTHLGIDIYVPLRFYSDVSVFIRDVSAVASQRALYPSKGGVFDYSVLTVRQLSGWAKSVSAIVDDDQQKLELFLVLKENEVHVRQKFLDLLGPEFEDKFAVRLEVWLRGMRPVAGNVGRLVRIADSDSVIYDADSRRSEYLYRRFPSRTAAVRAIQFGNPRFEPLNAYGELSSASRWQAFYSIPIATRTLRPGIKVIVGAMVVSFGLLERGESLVTMEDREAFQKRVAELNSIMMGAELERFADTRRLCDRVGQVFLEEIERHLSN